MKIWKINYKRRVVKHAFFNFIHNMAKEEKQNQIKMVQSLIERNNKEATSVLKELKNKALNNENIFEILMEAGKVCSLGQMSSLLFNVGGQYRRNM